MKLIYRFLAIAAIIFSSCTKETTPKVKVPQSPRALDIVPFGELNAGDQTLDSHANDWNESKLVMEYASYGNLYKDILTIDSPHYTRIAKMKNGSWIVMCHDELNGTVNGTTIVYALSDDMKKWKKCGPLFSPRNVTTSQGKATSRIYTNGYVLPLRNGDVLAVASYRLLSGYADVKSQVDHGLVIRRSTDYGQTWSEEQEIYHGTNWEAQLLELEDGEIQCYFSESRPWISGGHSGTGMIRSTDGGNTWTPDCVSETSTRVGNPYTIAREMYVNWENGKTLYTYQMPALVKLNSGGYAGAFESRKNNSSAYGVSLAWSEGFWEELVDSDGSYPVVTKEKCGPADRKSYAWTGTAPTIFQFPSGETVVGYSASWEGAYHLLYKMGGAGARNFGSTVCALPNQGSWGQVVLVGTHEMAAVNRDSQISGKVGLSYARYALNHRINATSRKVTMDGRNSDWAKTDEALFVGSKQNAQATLRCSFDSKNIYFLIEVLDEDLRSGDCLELYAAPYYESSLGDACVYVRADWSGLLAAGTYDEGGWPAQTAAAGEGSYETDKSSGIRVAAGYEGSLDSDSDMDSGYLAEISVPRKLLRDDDGYISVNFGIIKEGVESSADRLGLTVSTNGWIAVGGIK